MKTVATGAAGGSHPASLHAALPALLWAFAFERSSCSRALFLLLAVLLARAQSR